MPLTLITGKPGDGKTLYTITKVQERAKAENRQVYYHNIKDLKLAWGKLDTPADWIDPEKVPDGAIIVFDEAQEAFPPRPSGSRPQSYIQELAKHRHRGLDIYFITQDPGLIDKFVRDLTGKHQHVYRSFGAQSARVYNWDHVVDPDSRTERANCLQTDVFLYPKDTFELYTSATVHTVKRKLPRILVFWFPLVVALTLGAGYWAFYRLTHKHDIGKVEPVSGVAGGASGQPKLSDQWRIVGWFGSNGDEKLVLVGNDGRIRHVPKASGVVIAGQSLAAVVGGEVVTEYSGEPIDKPDKEEKKANKI